MKIPIAYNIRNLFVRRTTSIMTALGVALTVAVLLAVLALISGLRSAFANTGLPNQVLILRKGATAELASEMSREKYLKIRPLDGIARNASGEPMVSLEVVAVANIPGKDGEGVNLSVRGLTPLGLQMRERAKIVEGRWFEPGQREVCIGVGALSRFANAKVGSDITFGRGAWKVVGTFDAGRSVLNSEIIGDLNQVAADFDRADFPSSALVRLADEPAAAVFVKRINGDAQLGAVARKETDYYARQRVAGAPVQFMGTLIAIVMAIGSCFAAMNTMYAAVSQRAREIGTLRVLGFSRFSILTSFFVESLLLAALGGIIGCLLVLPLNNITTSVGNFITFSEITFSFRVAPDVMLQGVIFASIIGALGGLLPAVFAARREILTSLREF